MRSSFPKSAEPSLLQKFQKCLFDDEFWLNDIRSMRMGTKDSTLERYKQILIKNARLSHNEKSTSKSVNSLDTTSNIMKRCAIVADIADELCKMKNEVVIQNTKIIPVESSNRQKLQPQRIQPQRVNQRITSQPQHNHPQKIQKININAPRPHQKVQIKNRQPVPLHKKYKQTATKMQTFSKNPNFIKILAAANYQVSRMLLATNNEHVVLRARRYALNSIIEYPASHSAYIVAAMACFLAGLNYPFCTPSVYNPVTLSYDSPKSILPADFDKLRYLTSLHFALQASHIFNISIAGTNVQVNLNQKQKAVFKNKMNTLSQVISDLNAFTEFCDNDADGKDADEEMDCEEPISNNFIEIKIKREYVETNFDIGHPFAKKINKGQKTDQNPYEKMFKNKSVEVPKRTMKRCHREHVETIESPEYPYENCLKNRPNSEINPHSTDISKDEPVDLTWHLSHLRTIGVRLTPFDNNSVKLLTIPMMPIFGLSCLEQFLQRSDLKQNLPYFDSVEDCLPKIIQTMSVYRLSEFIHPESDYLTAITVLALKRYEKEMDKRENDNKFFYRKTNLKNRNSDVTIKENSEFILRLERLYVIVFQFLLARLSSIINLVNIIQNGSLKSETRSVKMYDENRNYMHAKCTKTRLQEIVNSFRKYLKEKKVVFESKKLNKNKQFAQNPVSTSSNDNSENNKTSVQDIKRDGYGHRVHNHSRNQMNHSSIHKELMNMHDSLDESINSEINGQNSMNEVNLSFLDTFQPLPDLQLSPSLFQFIRN